MSAAEIIVCTTCRGPDGAAGIGAALAAALAAAAPGTVAVTPAACLWSCAHGASAQLRAAGKTGYVLGGLVAADAGALLDFAAAYGISTGGTVPFDRWPPGVLGHFIARTPPPGATFA